mgnify:CR=1 FL=1
MNSAYERYLNDEAFRDAVTAAAKRERALAARRIFSAIVRSLQRKQLSHDNVEACCAV